MSKMSKNIGGHELAKQIEKLVVDFIASSQLAAAAAVKRAFAAAGGGGGRGRHPQVESRKVSARRSPEEMASLSERLYDAICSTPGERMTVLARAVGVAPRDLLVPSAHLKRMGRIRTAGQKQQTRYFPMVKSASNSS